MTYRKKTIRTMPETTRDLAKMINELDSVKRRMKNLLPRLRALERDSQALRQHSCQETMIYKKKPPQRQASVAERKLAAYYAREARKDREHRAKYHVPANKERKAP